MESFFDYVVKLNLRPHPEGGYYKEVYRSDDIIKHHSLPERYDGDRDFGTSIYYLLPSGSFSSFHKLKSDEIWHFYLGSPLDIYILTDTTEPKIITLGDNISDGNYFQFIIPKGTWFAATPKRNEMFSLVGCTVCPGFNFNDFEMGNKQDLLKIYPQHKDLIERFTIK